MPRATLLKHITVEDRGVASHLNVLGAKGVGEAGCTASIPALTSAVLDALRPAGVAHLDMPFTPLKVWTALRAERSK